MSNFFNPTASAAPTSTTGDTSKDVEITAGLPSDGISDISFSPTNDHLAVASWDKTVRIFEINTSSGSVTPKWLMNCKPVTAGKPDEVPLCVSWSRDGSRIAAGGDQGTIFFLDLRNATEGQVNPTHTWTPHGAGIKGCRWFQSGGEDILATGSWDKTVKYWDLQSENPIGQVQCQDRVYSMDVKNDLLVIATAERHIHIVILTNPNTIYKTIQSPLKWQTRVISCFTDATGFAVGSIEGRCAIQYCEDKDTSLNFSFKCHRQQDPNTRDVAKVYSVNAISFHPEHGTFSTAGSDGTFHFWDKDAKHRLKGYPEVGGSITATAFNKDGNIFAYAISYDWSKGYSFNSANYPIKIKLHPVGTEECKPRPGTKKR